MTAFILSAVDRLDADMQLQQATRDTPVSQGLFTFFSRQRLEFTLYERKSKRTSGMIYAEVQVALQAARQYIEAWQPEAMVKSATIDIYLPLNKDGPIASGFIDSSYGDESPSEQSTS